MTNDKQDASFEAVYQRAIRSAVLWAVAAVTVAGALSQWYFAIELKASVGLLWAAVAAVVGAAYTIFVSRSS